MANNLVKQASKYYKVTKLKNEKKIKADAIKVAKQKEEEARRKREAEAKKQKLQASHQATMKAHEEKNAKKVSTVGGKNRSASKTAQTNVKKQQTKTIATTKSGQAYAGFVKGYMGVTPNSKYMTDTQQKEMESSGAYSKGHTVGTLAGYATGYGGAGKATAKTAEKVVASKVGQKVATKLGASTIAKKVGANTLKNTGRIVTAKTTEKAGKKVAEKVLKEVVKDTVADATVGTVLDTKSALESGEKFGSKEYFKTMGENALLNLGVGGAVDVLPTAIKGLKGASKTNKLAGISKVKKTLGDTQNVSKARTLKEGRDLIDKAKADANNLVDMVKPKTLEKGKLAKNKLSVGEIEINAKGKGNKARNKGYVAEVNGNKVSAPTKKDLQEKIKGITKTKTAIDNQGNIKLLNYQVKNNKLKTNYNIKEVGGSKPFKVTRNNSVGVEQDIKRFASKEEAQKYISNKDIGSTKTYPIKREYVDADAKTMETVQKAIYDKDFKKYLNDNNIRVRDIAKNENKQPTETISKLYNEFKGTNEQLVNTPKKQSTKVAKQSVVDNSKTLEDMANKTASDDADEAIARVTNRTIKESDSLKNRISKTYNEVVTKVADSAHSLHKLGERTGDKEIDALVSNVRLSRARASAMINGTGQYLKGEKSVGKSVKEIFKPMIDRGPKYYDAFQNYMFNKANMDAMAEGKVFGKSRTADESAKIVARYEKSFPEFKKSANEVYNYLDNLMKIRVDSGLVSQDLSDTLKEMYEHYVPKQRVLGKTSGVTSTNGSVIVQNGIKKFKGSNKDLMPLHEQIAQMTESTLRASSLNELGLRVAKHLENEADVIKATPINAESEAFGELVKDKDGVVLKTLKQNGNDYSFIIKENGIPYEMKVSKEYFDAFKDLADGGGTKKILGLYQANSLFRNLVTAYNPLFTVRNALRDFPDAFAFTQQSKPQFMKNYSKAWKEIMSNGDMWKRYQGLGGTGGSFYDINEEWASGAWKKYSPLQRMEKINQAVEQAPRFAEFVGLMNKGYSVERALAGAQDLTVNFGRSGQWTRFLNANGATFLNAGVQDLVRIQRTLKSGRILPLLEGVTLLGIAPSVVNEMLCGDDEYYQSLRTTDKDVNFFIPIGDGKFIKIPKGRFVASMSTLPQKGTRALMGNTDEETLGEFIKNTKDTVVGQLAPNNPLESNLLSPINAVKNNRTWYGTNIESRSDENLPANERYDEGTTELAKKLGEVTGQSPKKIDYLMKQYSGVIGQVGMPLMTKKAEGNILKNNFVTDAVTNNRIGADYYNKLDTLMQNKSSKNSTADDSIKYKYMNSIQSKINDYNSQISDVQNSNISDSQKLLKIRSIRKKLNDLEKGQIENYADFEQNIKRAKNTISSRHYTDNEDYENAVYRKASIKTIGAEQTLQNEYGSSKSGKEKIAKIKNAGVSADTYYKALEAKEKYTNYSAQIIAMHEAGINDLNIMKVVNGNLTQNTYNKAVTLYNQGYSKEQLEQQYKQKDAIKSDADTNGNGRLTKAELTNYINNNATSQSQARLLWATLGNSNWKNPY